MTIQESGLLPRTLEEDEWYPVYSLHPDPSPAEYEIVVTDPELIARYDAVMAEFDAIQKILGALK